MRKNFEIKICVSGAAEVDAHGREAYERGKELGREIARQGVLLLTGATTGFPYWAAMGATEHGGKSVGISPAGSEDEHIHAYKLPVNHMDFIIYTGFGFSGRNLMLTRSADAVIVGCGRIGTINEFTVAFEDGKPIGILEGPWATDEVIKTIIEKSHRHHPHIVFDSNPRTLVEKLISIVVANRKGSYRGYVNNLDEADDPAKDPIL